MRATDPPPCAGTRSRTHAISSLTKLAHTLHIQHHFPTSAISEALPIDEWNGDVSLRHRVQNIARNLGSIATVRIADKSSTMLFAFCRQWLWDQTVQFLTGEEYTSRPTSDNGQIQTALQTIMRKNKWPVNKARTLPLLYLLGKAKSLTKQCILWRPIAAIVEPQVQRFYLRTAARAFTLLLRLLVSEILGAFLVLKISDLGTWIHGLSDWQCTAIGEADCSGQFNNITPLSVVKDLRESVQWLAKRRRWNANDITWSIHRDNKKLDRAGMGTSSRFTHIKHTELEKLVYFSLLTDTHTHEHRASFGHVQEPSPWEGHSVPRALICDPYGAPRREWIS